MSNLDYSNIALRTDEYSLKYADVRVKNLFAKSYKYHTHQFKTVGSGLGANACCCTASNGHVYICPYGTLAFTKYNPYTATVSTYYTASGGTNCYSACTSLDGRFVYFFPSVFGANTNTYKIDTSNDSVSVIAFSGPVGFTTNTGQNAISGCYLEPTGRYIYMVPNTCNMLLKFDTVTEVFTSLYTYPNNNAKYNAICRCFDPQELLLIPFSASLNFQKVNVVTDVVTTLAVSSITGMYGAVSGYRFRYVYCTSGGIIYEIDTISLSTRSWATADTTSYRAPILMADGYTIMFPPASSNRMLWFDTRLKKYWYTTNFTGSFAARYAGASWLPNGDILLSNGQSTSLGLVSFKSHPLLKKEFLLNTARNRY